MNRVAVCAFKTGVIIVAFILMDNHFHFELHSETYGACSKFVKEFTRLSGMYNTNKYGEKNTFEGLQVQILPINGEDYFLTLLCYIVKNPTKARMAMFYNYPWGTGPLYFNENRTTAGARTIGSMGRVEVRKLLKTRMSLPPEWKVLDGVILPENYVPVKQIEKMLKTPRAYMYFLSLNKDDAIESELSSWHDMCLTDSELRAIREEMSMELFNTGRLRDLSVTQRLVLARKLRYKYHCSVKQIARIVQIPYEQLGASL